MHISNCYSTVKVNMPVKRPANTGSSNKSIANPSKRSTASDINPAVTVTGAPVNPSTAKALASKLTERSNQQNRTITATSNSTTNVHYAAATNPVASNDVPIPPLISIHHGGQQHVPENEIIMPITMEMEMVDQEANLQPSAVYTINDYEAELNVPTFNILKNSTHNNHYGIENSVYDITPFPNSVPNDDVSKDAAAIVKMHHCNLCGKTFNKVRKCALLNRLNSN